MIRRRTILLSLACLALLGAGMDLSLYPAAAAPHAITSGEVMAAVNALRQSQGLQPYTVDPGITAYAQEHSEYQARIDESTHLHSDGQVSLVYGLVENVAGGDVGYLTAEAVVYEIWNDPVHGKHMTGYPSGAAGVGVASNSTTTFVTLNVRPGNAEGTALPGGTPGAGLLTTPIALVPLHTATMNPNGTVIHEVGYGQSLWAIAIAYGVPIARIRALNGLAPDDTSIYAGQRLLIVPAGSITPTPQPSETGIASPTASSPTPLALRVSPSPMPSGAAVEPSPAGPSPPAGLASRIPIDPILAGIIGLAVVGLLLVLSSGIKISRR